MKQKITMTSRLFAALLLTVVMCMTAACGATGNKNNMTPSPTPSSTPSPTPGITDSEDSLVNPSDSLQNVDDTDGTVDGDGTDGGLLEDIGDSITDTVDDMMDGTTDSLESPSSSPSSSGTTNRRYR